MKSLLLLNNLFIRAVAVAVVRELPLHLLLSLPPPPPPPLRIKQPEYQCYRERIGVARSIAVMEDISAELKALLLVGLVNECHGSALAFSVLSYRG